LFYTGVFETTGAGTTAAADVVVAERDDKHGFSPMIVDTLLLDPSAEASPDSAGDSPPALDADVDVAVGGKRLSDDMLSLMSTGVCTDAKGSLPMDSVAELSESVRCRLVSIDRPGAPSNPPSGGAGATTLVAAPAAAAVDTADLTGVEGT